MRLKKALFLLLVIFIIIDLSLFIALLNKSNDLNKVIDRNRQNLKEKPYRYISGKKDIGSLSQVELTGYVLNKPSRINTSNVYSFKLSLEDTNKNELNVILGSPNEKILLKKPGGTTGKVDTIKNVMPFIKKRSLVRIQFFVEDPNIILTDSLCSELCKIIFTPAIVYWQTNIDLYKDLKEGKKLNKKSQVGALSAIYFE